MNSKNNKGFIYCLYNPTFKSYGNNVYKLGKTINLTNRMSAYTTSYVDKSEYKITSSELNDRNIAENMLFKELELYRINMNREFFNCDIKIINEAFKKIEKHINYNESKSVITNKKIDKYHCIECNKSYKTSKSLWNHNNRYHDKKPKIIEYKCIKCNKIYDTKQKKYYHQKKCTIIKNEQSIIPITINNYNNDNLEYINEIFNDELFNNMIRTAEYITLLPQLIKNIKFNSNHKENNNVKITSDRSKVGLYYDQNNWQTINKNELLDDLYNYSLKILSKYFEDKKESLSDDILLQYQTFLDIVKLKSETIKKKIENIAYIFTKNNENDSICFKHYSSHRNLKKNVFTNNNENDLDV